MKKLIKIKLINMTTVEEFINSKPYSLKFLENHTQIMKLIYEDKVQIY